jgi:hypothetical protein
MTKAYRNSKVETFNSPDVCAVIRGEWGSFWTGEGWSPEHADAKKMTRAEAARLIDTTFTRVQTCDNSLGEAERLLAGGSVVAYR